MRFLTPSGFEMTGIGRGFEMIAVLSYRLKGDISVLCYEISHPLWFEMTGKRQESK